MPNDKKREIDDAYCGGFEDGSIVGYNDGVKDTITEIAYTLSKLAISRFGKREKAFLYTLSDMFKID